LEWLGFNGFGAQAILQARGVIQYDENLQELLFTMQGKPIHMYLRED